MEVSFETLQQSVIGVLPELVLIVVSLVVLVAGVFIRQLSGLVASLMAVGAVLVAIVASFHVAGISASASPFNGAFVMDEFSLVGRVIVFLAAATALVMGLTTLERDRLLKLEYPILILLATAGMGVMITASDLLTLYMGIELQSLALYVLAAFKQGSRRSAEAGLKYFVLGALSSGILLYGASLIYGVTGETTFTGIAAASADITGSIGLSFGAVFLLAGLGFKVSAAPFHMWTPDVYEGSPTPVTAFFSAAPKAAAMFLFARVMVEAFPALIDQWQTVLAIMAALSMIVGALAALVQTNIKRLMAYSSIGHAGYALMGLVAGTEQGIHSLLLYMSIYVISTLGIFACILSMRRPEGMTEDISDLDGLAQSHRPLAIAFTVFLFSLAGLPWFLGFFAKLAVFLSVMDAGIYWLCIVAVVASAVAAYYYLAILKRMWFDPPALNFETQNGVAVRTTLFGTTILVGTGIAFLLPWLNSVAAFGAKGLF